MEGHLDVEIFGPGGKKPIKMPSLYDYGPLSVYFSRDGKRVWFVTPCLLERKDLRHPCLNERGESIEEAGLAFHLYEWSEKNSVFTLLRRDLPPRAVPSPDGKSFAWLKDGQVCAGDPAKPRSTKCSLIPGKTVEGFRCRP